MLLLSLSQRSMLSMYYRSYGQVLAVKAAVSRQSLASTNIVL